MFYSTHVQERPFVYNSTLSEETFFEWLIFEWEKNINVYMCEEQMLK
jgi:hypothetical protein